MLTQKETQEKIYELVRKKDAIALEMLGPELCMEVKDVVMIENLIDLLDNLPEDLMTAYNNDEGQEYIVTKTFFEKMTGESASEEPVVEEKLSWFERVKNYFRLS